MNTLRANVINDQDSDLPYLSYEQALQHPEAVLYLDCENEIPMTCPMRYVKCSYAALEKLCDDLALYGLLTNDTQCVWFARNTFILGDNAQAIDGVWVAPLYAPLGPPIRKILSREAVDLYNDSFNPSAHYFLHYHNQQLGETAIYLAATYGAFDSFERMLRCSPDLNVQNTDGNTPLHGAVYRNHAAMVQRLLELGASVSEPGANGKTPLHLALIDEFDNPKAAVEIAQLLIRANADVNAEDNFGGMPLDYAHRHQDGAELTEMLVSRGARRAKYNLPQ